MVRLVERLPPPWLAGTVTSIFLLQVAVTLARPVSTYRLLALGADGFTLGLTAACFALPPMLLAVGFGRWTERHHPAIPLAGGLAIAALAAFVLVFSENIPAVAVGTTALGIGHMSGTIGAQSIMAQARQLARAHQQVRRAHHCLGARPDRRPGTRRGDHRPQRRAQPRVDLVGPADRGLGLHRRSARRRSGDAHPDPGVDRPHGPGRAGVAPSSPAGDAGRADDQLLGQERR